MKLKWDDWLVMQWAPSMRDDGLKRKQIHNQIVIRIRDTAEALRAGKLDAMVDGVSVAYVAEEIFDDPEELSRLADWLDGKCSDSRWIQKLNRILAAYDYMAAFLERHPSSRKSLFSFKPLPRRLYK
jgi:hypothetical protein